MRYAHSDAPSDRGSLRVAQQKNHDPTPVAAIAKRNIWGPFAPLRQQVHFFGRMLPQCNSGVSDPADRSEDYVLLLYSSSGA
jgi:hypothetical protein